MTLVCILLLLIPTCTTLVVDYIASKKETENIIQHNTVLLNQAAGMMDERLRELQNTVLSILANREVLNFSTQTEITNNESLFDAWKVQQQLKNYCNASVASTISIYFSASDALISNTFVYDGDSDYNRFFRFGDLSYDEWRSLLQSNQVRLGCFYPNISTSGTNSSMAATSSMIYINAPLGVAAPKCRMTIQIEINQGLVDNTLSGIELYDTGSVYMLDQNGQLISSRGSTSATQELLQDLSQYGMQAIKLGGTDYTVVILQMNQ